MLKLSPAPMTQKSAWGDHSGGWIPISTLSYHLLYSWWDIGTDKLLWNGCTQPNSPNLGVEYGDLNAKIVPIYVSQVSLGWSFQMINSNLNLVSPFVILMMRYWYRQAAVKWVHTSKLTQSCCGRDLSAKIVPTHDLKVSLGWSFWRLNSNLNLL